MANLWMLRALSSVALVFAVVSLAFAIVGMVSYQEGWWKHTELGQVQDFGWYKTCFTDLNNKTCYRLDKIAILTDTSANISYNYYNAISKAGYAAFFLSLIGGFVAIIMIICLIIVIVKEEAPRIAVNLASQNGFFWFYCPNSCLD